MNISKKSISPIIATLLLVTVSIVIGVSMYDWYKEYTQNLSQDINDKGFSKEIKVDYINQDTLYAYNEYSKAQIQRVMVDGVECDITTSDTNFSKGTIELNFNEACTQNLNSNINEVVIVTDKGTYSSLLSVSDVNYVFTNNNNNNNNGNSNTGVTEDAVFTEVQLGEASSSSCTLAEKTIFTINSTFNSHIGIPSTSSNTYSYCIEEDLDIGNSITIPISDDCSAQNKAELFRYDINNGESSHAWRSTVGSSVVNSGGETITLEPICLSTTSTEYSLSVDYSQISPNGDSSVCIYSLQIDDVNGGTMADCSIDSQTSTDGTLTIDYSTKIWLTILKN